MDRIPGQFYRDSENRLYQLVTVARHRETGDSVSTKSDASTIGVVMAA